jgi:hypothetical protein
MNWSLRLPASPKQILTANLQEAVDNTRDQILHETAAIASQHKFLAELGTLFEHECPDYQEQFLTIREHLTEYLQLRQTFTDAESLQIEDLNDISERFAVACRIASEREKARDTLKSARAKLERARQKRAQDEAEGGQHLVQREYDIKLAAREVKQAILALQETIHAFISEKEKFNAFRTRRMRHSYSAFGKSVAHVTANEVRVLGNLINSIESTEAAIREQNPAVAAAIPQSPQYVPPPVEPKPVKQSQSGQTFTAPVIVAAPEEEKPVAAPAPYEPQYAEATSVVDDSNPFD